MEIFGANVDMLTRALDLRMINQRVISANIANVDTPGFQAQQMDFKASMAQAIAAIEAGTGAGDVTGDPGAFTQQLLGLDPTAEAIIGPTGDSAQSLDGNNVSLEKEIGALSNNGLMYQLTARLLAAQMRRISTVLNSEG